MLNLLEISQIGKSVEIRGSWGQGERGNGEWLLKWVSFWGAKNILKVDSGDVQSAAELYTLFFYWATMDIQCTL